MIALLDLDGTLTGRAAGFAAWARSFAAEWSLGDDDLRWLHRLDRTAGGREQFFDALSRRLPHTGTPERLWHDYRVRMPELTPAFPGVLAHLRTLRASGWRLVVVTNGRSQTQVGKLRRTGIADVVHGWCVSEDVGVRKPDPAIFAAALALAGGSDRTAAWMVGDDPAADVVGGHAAGLRTHWVSHGLAWPESEVRPDAVSASPAQALAALAG
ncbi:HAD family hydrolase [Cellulomonas telluris]|uniref:HAD family hydrolase n=1 Tax=Cellulomonas telluris TaxID=2306636 RepID=UPI0010A7F08B|nr:HAD family hydrolase [Cellulomonas telluris]